MRCGQKRAQKIAHGAIDTKPVEGGNVRGEFPTVVTCEMDVRVVCDHKP